MEHERPGVAGAGLGVGHHGDEERVVSGGVLLRDARAEPGSGALELGWRRGVAEP